MKNKAFKIGSISLVFLIIGFQTALLFSKASVLYIEAKRDVPDTVFVYMSAEKTDSIQTKQAKHSPVVQEVRENTKIIESFRFNPNTVSLEDLQRLGFSLKQAQSIINYRSKGGKFRRPNDFAKSYVVADSVFQRLKNYIDIPLIDINSADSLTLIQLPGIGGYFAKQIIDYRGKLQGYSYPEQLLEIRNFDADKYEGLKDLITCNLLEPYPFWSLSVDQLSKHPYIANSQIAKSIDLYKQNTTKEKWTISNLYQAGIITESNYNKLSHCNIASP